MFAEIGSTSYNVMLLLHVLAVIIVASPRRGSPRSSCVAAGADRVGADAMQMSILRLLARRSLAVAGILGFGLAGMSDKVFKMSQTWLSIAIVLWLVQLAVLFFVARPGLKALAEGDASARGRVMAATGVTHLILLVMLYLMIWKPGGPF